MHDFVAENRGSLWLLRANTDEARAWADEHLPEDRAVLHPDVTPVESRYVLPILDGIEDAGLSVAVRP